MVEVKDNPTVSVIIPTYNRAHLIGMAISSVLDQTYHDFEIIVVDDASTDNTEEVVKSFKDERIRYIHHKTNRGGSAARNTGIKAVKGEYVGFLDDDDEWLPEKLEKQMKGFENAPSEVGVVYTGFWKIKGNKKSYIPYSWVTQKEGDIRKELIKGNFIGTPTTLIKKECFEKTGIFDESLPRLQDWELVIRLSKCYSFKCIDEPLVNSYHQPHSISTDPEAYVKALVIILTKHFEDFKKNRKSLSKRYFTIGNILCSTGDFKKAKGYLIKSVKAYPLNIKLFLILFISSLGQDTYNKVVKNYRKIIDIMKIG